MTSPPPLLPGIYYHIYNRGNNRQNIFLEARNYAYFLRLYTRHIEPVAETYAYCLLRNHFHLLIKTKTPAEQAEFFQRHQAASSTVEAFQPLEPSRQFGKLFIAYAKAINKAYGQTGSLFQNPFGRLPVSSDAYFVRLITYIHQNPQKHHFVADFRDWPYSSYQAFLSTRLTHLPRAKILAWFGGAEGLAAVHLATVDGHTLSDVIGEDND